MKWGHKISVGRNKQEEVTLADYCDYTGAEYPPQPDIPICGEHVWQWWWELNARRPPGFESLAPLPYSEIQCWLLLTGRQASREEIHWLIAMDNAWVATIAEQRNERHERERARAELEQTRKR